MNKKSKKTNNLSIFEQFILENSDFNRQQMTALKNDCFL